jgi:hypothetical protein
MRPVVTLEAEQSGPLWVDLDVALSELLFQGGDQLLLILLTEVDLDLR